MPATILGYTQGKLEKKAEKRGVMTEAYLVYLRMKQQRRKKKNR